MRLLPTLPPVAELKPGRNGELAVVLKGRSQRPATTFEEAEPDDVALLLHTSGTTGRPDFVPLLHRNLVATSPPAIAARTAWNNG